MFKMTAKELKLEMSSKKLISNLLICILLALVYLFKNYLIPDIVTTYIGVSFETVFILKH